MLEIGKSAWSLMSYNLNKPRIFIVRMDDMIVDFHMWLHYRYPVVDSRRCPLQTVVEHRNRHIYPFIKYIHSLFKE